MKTVFFTGKGDSGESEVGKSKISKDHPALVFLGSLDELNSWLGFCRVRSAGGSAAAGINTAEILRSLQEMLFIAQAETGAGAFGYPKGPTITAEITEKMEATIVRIDGELGGLHSFVVPGGSEVSAMLDFGRTIARRAERDAVRYNLATGKITPEMSKFLNRLSSLLFALARYENHREGITEDRPSYGI